MTARSDSDLPVVLRSGDSVRLTVRFLLVASILVAIALLLAAGSPDIG